MDGLLFLYQPWEEWFVNFYHKIIGFLNSLTTGLSNLKPYESIFLYTMIGFSFGLLLFNILWYRKDTEDGLLQRLVTLLLTLVSVVEILYILTFIDQPKEYLDFAIVGWGIFIVNFLVFLILLANQFLAFYLLIKKLPVGPSQEDFVPYIVLSWFVVFGLTFLFNWIYYPGNGMSIALLILLQFNYLIALLQGSNTSGHWGTGILYFLIYLIWSIALTYLVSYYFLYLFIALAFGLSIIYLIYYIKNKDTSSSKTVSYSTSSSGSSEKKCPFCGREYQMGTPTCQCEMKWANGTFYGDKKQ
jgi:hypothetical protein